MKEPKSYLAKAKTWNFVMLILSCLSLLIDLVGLPSKLNPQEKNFEGLGQASKDAFAYQSSWMFKAFTIVDLLLLVGLIVLYFIANKKMAAGIVPPKFPYFIVLGWFVVTLFFATLTSSGMSIEGIAIGAITFMITLVMTLITAIVPIMIIVNLFKATPDEGQMG